MKRSLVLSTLVMLALAIGNTVFAGEVKKSNPAPVKKEEVVTPSSPIRAFRLNAETGEIAIRFVDPANDISDSCYAMNVSSTKVTVVVASGALGTFVELWGKKGYFDTDQNFRPSTVSKIVVSVSSENEAKLWKQTIEQVKNPHVFPEVVR